MSLQIIPRAQWGAKYDRGFSPAPLPAREVWLHHSATIAPDLLPPFDDDDESVRLLERIGEQRFGGGISYTFVVTPVGRVYEGHGVDRQGAHTKNRNDFSRAICLIGNYDLQHVSDAQIASVAGLLRLGKDSGWWLEARLNGGHRDAPGASTACPGRFGEAAISVINAQANQPKPPPPPAHRTLQVVWPRMRGEDIRQLQRHLNRWYPSYSRITEDGMYGLVTQKVIREYQKRKGIMDTGIVGQLTWRELDKEMT